MAVLRHVLNGTVTLPADTGSVDVTLSTSLNDINKAFLVFNMTPSTDTPNTGLVAGFIVSTTTIRFIRSSGATTAPALTVEWYVAEFTSGVIVEHGNAVLINGTTPPQAINLSRTFDTSKSFIIVTGRNSGSTYGDDEFYRLELINGGTQLGLWTYYPTLSSSSFMYYQVIEFDGASVQSGNVTLASGDSSATATVTNATTGWLIMSVASETGTSTNMAQKMPRGYASSSTQLTFDRKSTGTAMGISYFLVHFSDGTSIQRDVMSFTTSDTLKTATISAVDLAKTIVTLSGLWNRSGSTDLTTADNPSFATFQCAFDSTTALDISRTSAGGATSDIQYNVVQFSSGGTTHQGVLATSSNGASSFGGIFVVVAHPTGDVSTGGWTTTPLYQKIDEVTASTADFVTSADNPSNDTFEVNLTSLSGVSPDGPHTIEYVLQAVNSSTLDVTIALVENTTVIASWTHNNIPTEWTRYSSVLTSGERAAITDYTNLRLRITATS